MKSEQIRMQLCTLHLISAFPFVTLISRQVLTDYLARLFRA